MGSDIQRVFIIIVFPLYSLDYSYLDIPTRFHNNLPLVFSRQMELADIGRSPDSTMTHQGEASFEIADGEGGGLAGTGPDTW